MHLAITILLRHHVIACCLRRVLHCPQDRGVHNVHKAKHRPTPTSGTRAGRRSRTRIECPADHMAYGLSVVVAGLILFLSQRLQAIQSNALPLVAFRALAQSLDLLGVLRTKWKIQLSFKQTAVSCAFSLKSQPCAERRRVLKYTWVVEGLCGGVCERRQHALSR